MLVTTAVRVPMPGQTDNVAGYAKLSLRTITYGIGCGKVPARVLVARVFWARAHQHGMYHPARTRRRDNKEHPLSEAEEAKQTQYCCG
jgi:hypothetical protein